MGCANCPKNRLKKSVSNFRKVLYFWYLYDSSGFPYSLPENPGEDPLISTDTIFSLAKNAINAIDIARLKDRAFNEDQKELEFIQKKIQIEILLSGLERLQNKVLQIESKIEDLESRIKDL